MSPHPPHPALLLVGGLGVLVAIWNAVGPGVATATHGHAASAMPFPGTLPAPEPRGPIRMVPTNHDLDPAAVALGARLFVEQGLSGDGTVSCSTCHDLTKGGADGAALSAGTDDALGDFNAPTVLNAGLSTYLNWDGRARTLEEQIDGPLTDPREMASSWDAAVGFLRADPGYVRAFRSAYGRPPDEDSLRDALATYVRSLTTPDSRFDRWLRGEAEALDDTELRGYRVFLEVGCVSCHQGVNLGGNLLQVFGTVHDYFADRGPDRPADLGRHRITGRERDRHRFRVPGLRNVALTAPYLHDGSIETLPEVVGLMGYHELGVQIAPDEVDAIVHFLNSLTGRRTP